jgi:hypothetical protein
MKEQASAMIQTLCESCKHMREVTTARSRFLLCKLSVANAAYPKYPPQPVLRCDGYERKDDKPSSREL